MPKKFPPEFKRDVVTVARRGDLTVNEVAASQLNQLVLLGGGEPVTDGVRVGPVAIRARSSRCGAGPTSMSRPRT